MEFELKNQDVKKQYREERKAELLQRRKNLESIADELASCMKLAEGYGSQASHMRDILFSVYEPETYQCPLDGMMRLDTCHIKNILHVINYYVRTRTFVFDAIYNGEYRLRQLMWQYLKYPNHCKSEDFILDI